jgi:hypothetical protein
MDALLTAIVIWISANYALPASLNHPRIERVASVEMAGLRYRGLLSALQRKTIALQEQESSFEKRRDVVALYNDETRTIYARRTVRPRARDGPSPSERSRHFLRMSGRARKARLRGAGQLAAFVRPQSRTGIRDQRPRAPGFDLLRHGDGAVLSGDEIRLSSNGNGGALPLPLWERVPERSEGG